VLELAARERRGALAPALGEPRKAGIDGREPARDRGLVAAVAVGADGKVLGDGERAEDPPPGRHAPEPPAELRRGPLRDPRRPAIVADHGDDLGFDHDRLIELARWWGGQDLRPAGRKSPPPPERVIVSPRPVD
jgi:hypothetical protein